jgi:hypothetical protein
MIAITSAGISHLGGLGHFVMFLDGTMCRASRIVDGPFRSSVDMSGR